MKKLKGWIGLREAWDREISVLQGSIREYRQTEGRKGENNISLDHSRGET